MMFISIKECLGAYMVPDYRGRQVVAGELHALMVP